MNSLSARIQTAYTILVGAAAFMLPFSVDILLYKSPIAEQEFSPLFFAATFFSFSELLFLLALILFFIRGFIDKATSSSSASSSMIRGLLFLFLGIISSVFFSPDPLIHLFLARFLFIGSLLYLFFSECDEKVQIYFLWGLLLAGGTQSVLMAFQFIHNASLGLHFLGEPIINNSTLGVAKFVMFGDAHIRAYGTFLHPNIAACFLLLTLFLQLKSKEFIISYIGKYNFILLFLLIVGGIILTFSKTGFLVLGIMTIVGSAYLVHAYLNQHIPYLSKYLLIILGLCIGFASFVLFFFVLRFGLLFEHISFFWDRVYLIKDSLLLFLHFPLGVGLGNFTLVLPVISAGTIPPWNLQPVHNAFLLAANELGFFGILGLLYIFRHFYEMMIIHLRKKIFLYILPAITLLFFALFDHMLLTSWPVIALFWILASPSIFSSNKVK